MKNIKKNTVIASVIMYLNENIISVEKFYNYIKEICNNCNHNNYMVSNISIQDIYNFFKYYIYIGRIENNKIIINETPKLKEKIKKYFLTDIDKDILELLKIKQRFIFTLIYKRYK